MVTCCQSLRVCLCVCEYNKQEGCILDCEVQGLYFPLLLISLPWWVSVCIQTYDSPGGPIGEACSPKRCQVPDSEQMRGASVCVCVSLWREKGWGWQVLNCVEVEWATMGISRFMTLVRKLTNQVCFLFCSYNVNGAPSCPSCNHPRPPNCTDGGLDPLSFSFPVYLYRSLSHSLFCSHSSLLPLV